MVGLEPTLSISGHRTCSDWMSQRPRSLTPIHLPIHRPSTVWGFDGRCHYAVCAIDALGVAGMLGSDTRIVSACRRCRGRIEIGTARNGKSLGRYRPTEAVV